MNFKRIKELEKPDLFLGAVLLASLAFLVVAALAPSWINHTPEYKWPILHHGLVSRLPAAVIVTALACALGLVMVFEIEKVLASKWGRARVYIALFLLGAAFQLGPAAVHRMGFIELPLRVYLPDHTSYLTDAGKIMSARHWTRDFHLNIRDLSTHSRTHPPGAVLLFYAAQRLAASFPSLSEWYVETVPRSAEAMQKFGITAPQALAGGAMALVLLAVACAIAPLTFAIGRMIIDDRRAAWAAIIFAASPAFSHKTPVLDHLLAGLVLLALWLTVSAICRRHLWRIALAGVVVGLGLWLGTTLLAAVPLCALYLAAAIRERSRDGTGVLAGAVLFASMFAIFVMTAVVTNLFAGEALGSNFIDVYRAITEVGWKINNEASGRLHAWMWVAFNPYEMAVWAGIPAAAYLAKAVYEGAKKGWKGHYALINHWLAAMVVFMVALDVTGKVCYEASRLAWFCFPLMALEAARPMPAPGPVDGMARPALLLAAIAAGALVFRMVF